MKQFRFLLDEHVPASLHRAVIQKVRDIVIWRLGDVGAPARGTLDPDILVWCERNEFSLITNNRASMPVHL